LFDTIIDPDCYGLVFATWPRKVRLFAIAPRATGRSQMSTARRVSALPTANGGIARAAYARATDAGLDLKPLLHSAGLSLKQIRTADVRISVRSQVKFLNAVADALEDDFLGIHIAQSIELRELGLLYYVMASSENLANALTRLARYSGIHNEGVHLAFTHHRQVAMSFEHSGFLRADDRHQVECFMAILLRVCRQLTDRHLLPQKVQLAHRRSGARTFLTKYFGCEIEFGARRDQIIFSPDVGDAAIAHADPYLNSLLRRYCEDLLRSRRAKQDAWTSKVENCIAPLLPHGEATIEKVAETLGVSLRTLGRRLQKEDTSFVKIVQDLRLRLAKNYFREPGMSIAQIAWLLGYQEPSAFSHAFKRWTGKSPRRDRIGSKVLRP
jgi:AraC-like DNA-binding protein